MLPPSSSTHPYRVLGLTYFAALAFGFNLQMIPPLVGLLVSDLSLTHSQAGLLMGLFTLPGFLLALPGGILADRFGPGRLAVASLALMTAGTLLMVPFTAATLFPGRFLAGAGAAVLVTVAPQILTRHIRAEQAGLAMGLYNTAVPLATILSFNLMGSLAVGLGERTVFAAVAALSAAALLSFLVGYQEHPEDWRRGNSPQGGPLLSRLGLRGLGSPIWILSLAWALYNISLLGFFTFGGDYFHQAGYPLPTANLLDSLPMFVALPLVPFAGWLLARPGRRCWAVFGGCLLPGLCILLVPVSPGQAWILMALTGAGMALIPPAVFTLVPAMVPPGRAGTGFGVLNSVFNIAVFLGVPAAGALRDATGGYTASFLFLGGAGLAGAVLSLLLPRRLTPSAPCR